MSELSDWNEKINGVAKAYKNGLINDSDGLLLFGNRYLIPKEPDFIINPLPEKWIPSKTTTYFIEITPEDLQQIRKKVTLIYPNDH